MAIDLGPDGLTLGSTTINDWDDVGGGKVLQVEQTITTAKQNFALNNTFSTYTALNTSITPSATSNKVLIKIVLNVGMDVNNNAYPAFRIVRDDTELAIALGDSAGSRRRVTGNGGIMQNSNNAMQCLVAEILDSPSTTSSTTYKVQMIGYDNRTFAMNATGNSDANAGAACVSSMTLMEIAG